MPTMANIILNLLSNYALTFIFTFLAGITLPFLIAAFRMSEHLRRHFQRIMDGPAHRIGGRNYNRWFVEIMATIWEDWEGEVRAEAEEERERAGAGEGEFWVLWRILGMGWRAIVSVLNLLRMLARRWDEW
ncbi:hypothetical protein FQN52_001339 [Onygenales sp. PD_12]|nr:hypothetical protein FQN53_007875 [Emmonsiellopsis sp. PD_33]KAK2781845.1 hypothetical protein FQN52_001339 [Onygenales sp. PD_12]